MDKSKKKLEKEELNKEKIEKALFRLEVLRDALELLQSKIIFFRNVPLVKIQIFRICYFSKTYDNFLYDIKESIEKYIKALNEIIQELNEEWSKLKQN